MRTETFTTTSVAIATQIAGKKHNKINSTSVQMHKASVLQNFEKLKMLPVEDIEEYGRWNYYSKFQNNRNCCP